MLGIRRAGTTISSMFRECLKEKSTEWAEVKLACCAKHFTKSTEMLIKKYSVLLNDKLTIEEVNLLHVIAGHAHEADEGKPIGNTVMTLVNANLKAVESVRKKLSPMGGREAEVGLFLLELADMQAAIKEKEGVCLG